MDVLTYSDTRARLKAVMDRVARDRTPVMITRRRGEAVVMVSLADWAEMQDALGRVARAGDDTGAADLS